MRKSNLNPIFLKFTGIIKGVPKYWAQNSHLIYAISLVLFLPFLVLSILLFLLGLNIKNTTLAIFIVIIVTSALLTWLYQEDFKKTMVYLKHLITILSNFFITIIPITLTLLSTGYTLDQISEQNKSEKDTTVKCVKSTLKKINFLAR